MKRQTYIISFLLLLVAPISATNNQQDSLRIFLEYIGEDSVTISKIMKSPEAADPLETIESYLMLNTKLVCDSNRQEMVWIEGWSDSAFVCKCAKFLHQLIINDTALHLVEPCLLEAFLINHKSYSASIILECAEQAITVFHARNAFLIPNMYYCNHEEIDNRQENSQFYEMVEMILSPQKYVYTFDTDTNKKINAILAESNESSPYYVRFRNKLDGYSDMDLARISKEQEAELANILLQGMANGEKKSQMTYAFMLLTGQFVEKDEALGNELLRKLLE
ncbi:MAG: hypothetical protein K6A36_08200 [Paludibacteraceae bacterium]|nr:hypothetical protein [Paludibacteraceae bacterium]